MESVIAGKASLFSRLPRWLGERVCDRVVGISAIGKPDFTAGCGRYARQCVQLDSLADVVTFGAAPAILVYHWGLSELGTTGIVGASLFTICGALRLARFNIIAEDHKGVMKYFTGMPIPAAAGIAASLVLTVSNYGDTMKIEPVNVLVLMVILSYLMVSNIRYRTFKDVRPRPLTLAAAIFIVFISAFTAIKTNVPVMLFGLGTAYLMTGLIEEVINFGRKHHDDVNEEEEKESHG